MIETLKTEILKHNWLSIRNVFQEPIFTQILLFILPLLLLLLLLILVLLITNQFCCSYSLAIYSIPFNRFLYANNRCPYTIACLTNPFSYFPTTNANRYTSGGVIFGVVDVAVFFFLFCFVWSFYCFCMGEQWSLPA